jgi:hypothetical protein
MCVGAAGASRRNRDGFRRVNLGAAPATAISGDPIQRGTSSTCTWEGIMSEEQGTNDVTAAGGSSTDDFNQDSPTSTPTTIALGPLQMTIALGPLQMTIAMAVPT